jgi:hypothetical protein
MFAYVVRRKWKRLAYKVAKVRQRVASRVALLRALNPLDDGTSGIGCLQGAEKRAWVVWDYLKSAF